MVIAMAQRHPAGKIPTGAGYITLGSPTIDQLANASRRRISILEKRVASIDRRLDRKLLNAEMIPDAPKGATICRSAQSSQRRD